MAAEVDLIQRGKPTQLIPLIRTHKKRGLRLIVLLRHFQQRFVRQPFGQRANGRRVAAKAPIAEGIHQIKANFLHCSVPLFFLLIDNMT